MIKTVGELLQALMVRETAILGKQDVTHPPTIGAMYEGLTKDALARHLPFTDSLSVVSGFAVGPNNQKSLQLDCMLITGQGEQIPYTEMYNVSVGQIIAVIEVKKTLYQTEIADGFRNLQSVLDIKHQAPIPSIEFWAGAFQLISGFSLPDDPKDIQDPTLSQLYHLLVCELAYPARILIGYEGFKTAKTLRTGLASYLKTLVGKHGGGPFSLPNLVMNPASAVVKANGFPYAAPIKDGNWPLVVSLPSEKPALTLLEIIWTRLHVRVGGSPEMFGEDMHLEAAVPLVKYKFLPDVPGWQMSTYEPLSKSYFLAKPKEWAPAQLDAQQHVVVMWLSKKGEIDLNSPPKGSDPETLKTAIDGLVKQGLIGADASRPGVYRLLPRQCGVAILPDGRVVAGEDISGRLTRWVSRYLSTRAPGSK